MPKGKAMKMKNTLLILLSLSFSFACHALDPAEAFLTEDQNQCEVTTSLDTLLDDNNTPLDSSIRQFRDFFATHDIGHLTLKNRSAPAATKTAWFNSSLLKYIKQSYNQRSYASYLSQDTSDIIDFFSLAHELNLPAEHLLVGIRLLYNKIKEGGAEIINDSVVLELLPTFAIHLAPHFDTTEPATHLENVDFIKKHTEEVILYKFTEHFAHFQTSPEAFIGELSHDLSMVYKHQSELQTQLRAKYANKQESLSRLRNLVIRFFELTIGRIIWNTLTPETIWPSVIAMAEGLKSLAEHNVLDHMDDLDDLFWTLTHRFCYFVELTGADLPLSFYAQVEQDLINKNVFFLESKEQDDGITSKKQFVIEALLKGKTRALALEQGLVISSI